tara:strand:- start:1458 stop:1562 length:105 start_codon:yes stop_codon:yes gene_type:complete
MEHRDELARIVEHYNSMKDQNGVGGRLLVSGADR